MNVRSILTISTLILLAAAPVFAQEVHVVQPNQTLWSIARLYNVSVDEIKSWNNLSGESIYRGQSLVVKPIPANRINNPGLNPFLYTVRSGDSLSALSLKFDISVDELKRLNALGNQPLIIGSKILIRRPIGITLYTVEPGDSLSLISARFDISQDDLKSINQLASAALVPGTKLRVFKPADTPLTHEVIDIDTWNKVAALYNTSVNDLQKMNPTYGTDLQPGTVLKLRTYASASTPAIFKTTPQTLPQVKATFPEDTSDSSSAWTMRKREVKAGESLWSIARSEGISVNDLIEWNSLSKNASLKIGQTLQIRTAVSASLPKATTEVSFPVDPAGGTNKVKDDSKTTAPASVAKNSSSPLPDFQDADQDKLHWDNYVVMDKSIPVFEWNNDYYYWTHPGELSQPNKGYFENHWPSPLDAYRKSRLLLDKFNAQIAKKPPLSKILDGYTIVLDPGHGGVDPGAIVKSSDGNGEDLYITEHEYVYDIALRMYALLKRHGARVEMTVLAPNHLIRDTEPANHTLINEKNQVYNDLFLNQSDRPEAWPEGSQEGLDKRIEVTDKFFKSSTPGKRVFLSLHADNNPTSPLGTGVYALETRDGTVDDRSLKFADKLVPFLGKNAYSRTQNLAVLRGNDADYKVLVEVHNLASDEQSWAMRFGSSRQLTAQKLVRGLLEYFQK